MNALLFVIALPWSPQSAWNLGDAHGFRASTSMDLSTALDRARYDGMSVEGGPLLAYHRGTKIGLELSFGARLQLGGWAYIGLTPLVLGLKQTLVGNERVALAVAVTFTPWEWNLDGNALWVRPELVLSLLLSEKWSMDFGGGVLVRPYWLSPLHDFGPLARIGFTVNMGRSAIFFGAHAGSEHSFYGVATPPPFPYVAARRFSAGLFVGYAKR